MVKFSSQAGYTLIELLVALALASFVALIVFSGLGSFSQSQPTLNAQKEFLANLRSVQAEVNNGAGGVSVRSVVIPATNGTSYTIVNSVTPVVSKSVVNFLPSNVKVSSSNSSQTGICFVNPNTVSYSATQPCTSDLNGLGNYCSSGNSGFLCVNGSVSPVTSFTVTFSGGGVSRTVTIEGNGMIINRIYGQ